MWLEGEKTEFKAVTSGKIANMKIKEIKLEK
jgi:hypothetical protein